MGTRWLNRHCVVLWWIFCCSSSVAAPIWTTSVDEAFRESSELGRPVLVLVTTATCGPCQALKQELRGGGALSGATEQLVVLELDLQSESFAKFRQSHPDGFTGAVPMIYLFDARGTRHYARSGLLPNDQMSALLDQVVRASGPSLQPHELSQMRQTLERVRTKARGGQLIDAYEELQSISSHGSSAAVVAQGRQYEQQLLDALEGMLGELDRTLADPTQSHIAAVRLAILYVQARNLEALQQRVRTVLSRHSDDPGTRNAILQAKFLVRARVAEQRQLHEEAIVSYTQILKIDRDSPIGLVAANRLQTTFSGHR